MPEESTQTKEIETSPLFVPEPKLRMTARTSNVRLDQVSLGSDFQFDIDTTDDHDERFAT